MKHTTISIFPIGLPEDTHDLSLTVPEFPSGPDPPSTQSCKGLLTGCDGALHFPVYLEEALLLESLIADEQKFRREHAEDWHERCWFILGDIFRAITGEVWGRMTGFIQAEDLETSKSCFAFSSATWRNFEAARAGCGKICLGWVHTHSLENLSDTSDIDGHNSHSADPLAQQTTSLSRRLNVGNQTTSGLFLSRQDVYSARRLGFNAPYHLTCVLDSDACLRPLAHASLSETFAVWGFVETRLCRRSIFIC